MPRSTLLVVVLVGVALVVIAFAAGAERIAGRSASPGSSQQATPQVAPLGRLERGQDLVGRILGDIFTECRRSARGEHDRQDERT